MLRKKTPPEYRDKFHTIQNRQLRPGRRGLIFLYVSRIKYESHSESENMRLKTESYLQMESPGDPRWWPASEMDRLRLGQHYTVREGRWRCLLTLC